MSTIEERGAGAVLVTGATGGIGTAVATSVVALGWPVSILDLSEAAVMDLVDVLNSERPGSAIGMSGDCSNREVVEAWTARTIELFGSVRGLVNVAGLFKSCPMLDLTMADIAETMTANLYSTIVCCQVVGREMISAGQGSIVNIASTAGEYGSISPAAHYAASKGAVIALTKSLAREFSPLGVRVNAVSPGPIDTAGRTVGSIQTGGEVASRALLNRMGQPKEIATCVTFLLGDDASYVTGHVLRANGGSLL
jgi:NAD(P)-dependent dehydrogenase (short-subunit alcohol dehydrogenase family)